MDTSNAPRFVSRQRECDLVMRGGITSGIVYPKAVAELARTFTFRSIGGTSAGAIAAVITAAAQYGVSSGANPRAFEAISHLPETLAQPVEGHSFINRLFAPDAATAPLYRLIAGVTYAKSGWDKLRAALASEVVKPRLLGGSASGALLAALLVQGAGATPAAALIAALPGAVTGALAGLGLAGLHLYRKLVPALVANRYGLCSGMAKAGLTIQGPGGRPTDMPSLTGWMHELIQSCAGRDAKGRPLTFGELWTADPKLWPSEAPPDPDSVTNRAIDLVLMSTNITRGISARIPHMTLFGPLFARKADLEALFPPAVVAHMIATGARLDPARTRPAAGDAPGDYIKLPEAKDLPVLFGARLSLSFPFLISAVPLFAPLRHSGSEPATLVRCWFSDGGLTSNFPIHFFDAPIPSRPTFAINLAAADVEFPAAMGDVAASAGAAVVRFEPLNAREAANDPGTENGWRGQDDKQTGDQPAGKPGADPWSMVWMPRGNAQGRVAPFHPFEAGASPGGSLAGFFFALIDSARLWGDNELMLMPGNRDRIAHVRMRRGEGGFNLDMPPETIADVAGRGTLAGQLLAARFGGEAIEDPKYGGPIRLTWDNHRWVRVRSFGAALERVGYAFVRCWRCRDYPSLLAESKNHPPSYRWASPAHHAYATDTLDAYVDFVDRRASAAEAAGCDLGGPFEGKEGGAPRPRVRMVIRQLGDSDPLETVKQVPLPRDGALTA